jgi:hypothetical protein
VPSALPVALVPLVGNFEQSEDAARVEPGASGLLQPLERFRLDVDRVAEEFRVEPCQLRPALLAAEATSRS